MIPRPVLFTLGVDDLTRETAFWHEVFGWVPSPRSQGDLVVYDFDGYALALHPRESLADDAGLEPQGTGFSGITLSINVPSEKEVEKRLLLAVHYGARLVRRAQKTSRGGFNGYFTTPSGHLFEVAFNPYWKLDADGRLTP